MEGQAPVSPGQGMPQKTESSSADPLDSQILQLMQTGRKIDAIKLYRETRRVGLKEAKDAVEALAQEHGIPQRSVGCTGVLLIAALGGPAWWLFA